MHVCICCSLVAVLCLDEYERLRFSWGDCFVEGEMPSLYVPVGILAGACPGIQRFVVGFGVLIGCRVLIRPTVLVIALITGCSLFVCKKPYRP